jgi:hypothetical protein
MLHHVYEIVLMKLCIESENVIMLKSWCGGLDNYVYEIATETGLTHP